MADQFITMSALNVRSLLEDRKTNTRRELSPRSLRVWTGGLDHGGRYVKPDADMFDAAMNNARDFRAIEGRIAWVADPGPHQSGAVMSQWLGRLRIEKGDRLWVKEGWRTFVSLDNLKPSEVWSKDQDRGAGIAYEAGGGLAITKGGIDYLFDDERDDLRPFGKLRNSRFMPKWASRLTLLVTEVRVQRLQDISAADAIAEGLIEIRPGFWWFTAEHKNAAGTANPVTAYSCLWEEINGPGSWGRNPFVAAYTFTVVKENIERIAV